MKEFALAQHNNDPGNPDNIGFYFRGQFIDNPWIDRDGKVQLTSEEAVDTYGFANVMDFVLQVSRVLNGFAQAGRFGSGKENKGQPYKKNGIYYAEDGERLFTQEDARAIINGTVADVEYGIHDPYDILPEDFV